MENENDFLEGTNVLNPVLLSDLDKEFCFSNFSKNESPTEGSNFNENHFFDGEAKENGQSDSKTASEDRTADDFFSPLFISKTRELLKNIEAYQCPKNEYEKKEEEKHKKKSKNILSKAGTKNAYQNFKLLIISYLKQFEKHSPGFDCFKREEKNKSIEIFENLLKEEIHASDLAYMFSGRHLKRAYMNGRSSPKRKVANFVRIKELLKRFLKFSKV